MSPYLTARCLRAKAPLTPHGLRFNDVGPGASSNLPHPRMHPGLTRP